MDRNKMLIGLTNKDFNIGSILATAATGAAVHGLMYPMTEVAYGLSDNFIKNVTPSNWRKPLPSGYRPQTVKFDKPNLSDKDKDKDWEKHRKIMDQLDGDQLRGYTLTLDPKYTNDAYSYLVGKGVNPGAKDKPYLSVFKNTELDFDNKEGLSEDTLNKLGGAAGVATLVGAGTLATSPVNSEEDRSKNKRRALRNALIGGGLYYLAKSAGSNESGNSTSGDKSDLVDEFGLDQPMDLSYPPTINELWNQKYGKDTYMEDLRKRSEEKLAKEEAENKELWRKIDSGEIKVEDLEDKDISLDKDMSMLNGLFR